MNLDHLTVAEQQGYDAFTHYTANDGGRANPYPPGSDLYKQWNAGWDEGFYQYCFTV